MPTERQKKGLTTREDYIDPRNPYIQRDNNKQITTTYHHKITKEKVWDGYIIPL